MTQRKPNPYFIRASATSAQPMHPLADYAAQGAEIQDRRSPSPRISPIGYEQIGGFQRVFEDEGGRVVKQAVAAARHARLHALSSRRSAASTRSCQGFAGSNPVKFMRQYKDQGITLPLLGGGVAMDDGLLKSFGDEAIGVISCVGLHRRSRHAEQQAICRRQRARLRRHPGLLCRRPLHQRHGGRSGAGDRPAARPTTRRR